MSSGQAAMGWLVTGTCDERRQTWGDAIGGGDVVALWGSGEYNGRRILFVRGVEIR